MPPPLVPVATLIQLAQSQAGNAVSGPLYQTLPIPDVTAEGPCVHFLYGITRPTPRGGAHLLAPSYLATFAADTGVFERMVAVTPARLGHPHHGAHEPLGLEPWHRAPTPEEAVERRAQLLECYDRLFEGLVAHSFDPSLGPVARRFQALFEDQREGLLAGYYQYLGQLFFHYVDQLAALPGSDG